MIRNTQGRTFTFGLTVMIIAVISSLVVILATVAQTPTPTIGPTPAITPTSAPTPTTTPADTPTPTAAPTDTPVPTSTPTETPAPTDTPVPTATPTNTPTDTPTEIPTITPTLTPTPTEISFTPTETPTETPTPTPGKSKICHKNKPDSQFWLIIEVDDSALPAHLGHGDFPPDSPPAEVNNRCMNNNECPVQFGDTITKDCGVRTVGSDICSCNCVVRTATGGTGTYTCKPKPNTCGNLACKYDLNHRTLVSPCSESDFPDCKCTLKDRDTGELTQRDCKSGTTDCGPTTCDLHEGDLLLESCTDTGGFGKSNCNCYVLVKGIIFNHKEVRNCKAS